MTQVPASSHGGGLPLSGGTLTGPLIISPTDNTATALRINAPVGAGPLSTQLVLVTSADKASSTLIEMDADGSIISHTNDALSGSISSANDDHGSYAAQLTYRGLLYTTQGVYSGIITSGALPTVAPVSGTPFQCATGRDVHLVIPFTGDATNNAATLLIQLSPDNVTFSTLDTLSIAAALNLTGAINVPISLHVPAAWYVKLTAVHGTIGTSTYY